jgi:hypothetical protein
MTRTDDENRRRQIVGGVSIIVVLAVLVCGTLIGWRYLPGLLGEWIGTMIGALTTPFILEGSFLVIGLMIVLALNIWRRQRDGDDFVHLEEVDDASLPEHAKWAIYRTAPLEGEVPSLQAQAEGALAIGDYESALEAIAAMSEADLKRPEILAVRLDLARASGMERLAEELERELAAAPVPRG